jgi:hypothetical protein
LIHSPGGQHLFDESPEGILNRHAAAISSSYLQTRCFEMRFTSVAQPFPLKRVRLAGAAAF